MAIEAPATPAATIAPWVHHQSAGFVGLGVCARGGPSLLLAELRGQAPIDYNAASMAIRLTAWRPGVKPEMADGVWPAAMEVRLVERNNGLALLLANLHTEAARVLLWPKMPALGALAEPTDEHDSQVLSLVEKPYLPGVEIAQADRWSAWPSQVPLGQWLFEPRLIEDSSDVVVTATRADGGAALFRLGAGDGAAQPFASRSSGLAGTALPVRGGRLLLYLGGPMSSTVFAEHPRYGGGTLCPARSLTAAVVTADEEPADAVNVLCEDVHRFAVAHDGSSWRIAAAHAEPARMALYRLLSEMPAVELLAEWPVEAAAFDVALACDAGVTVVATARQERLKVAVDAWVIQDPKEQS